MMKLLAYCRSAGSKFAYYLHLMALAEDFDRCSCSCSCATRDPGKLPGADPSTSHS